VASVAQGTSAVWNGVSLGEVVSITLEGVSAESVDVTPRTSATRYKSFSAADVDLGAMSMTLRGTAAMSVTNVGVTGSLAIAAPNAVWFFTRTMLERLGWSATVGDLQTYSVTFKLGT
jgi:hypothetical protein